MSSIIINWIWMHTFYLPIYDTVYCTCREYQTNPCELYTHVHINAWVLGIRVESKNQGTIWKQTHSTRSHTHLSPRQIGVCCPNLLFQNYFKSARINNMKGGWCGCIAGSQPVLSWGGQEDGERTNEQIKTTCSQTFAIFLFTTLQMYM